MFIVIKACKQTLLCFLLLVCIESLYAQNDSIKQPVPNERIGMDTITLTPQETRALQNATSYPGWYLVTQIAQFFNVGAYYSYLTPVGSFKKDVAATSAFSFDFGLDLTRMFGENDAYVHCMIGLNGDFANFGKTANPYTNKVGDTTFEVSVKNRVDVYSYYLEVDYRKSYLSPFISVAYSDIRFYPYKREKTMIHNSTVNSTSTIGGQLPGDETKGMNMTVGLKCRYRFNDHKELMVLTRVSYLISNPVEMMDLDNTSFSPTGQVIYTTKTVSPTWLMYSLGIKYNF